MVILLPRCIQANQDHILQIFAHKNCYVRNHESQTDTLAIMLDGGSLCRPIAFCPPRMPAFDYIMRTLGLPEPYFLPFLIMVFIILDLTGF